ncbi:MULTISPECIES: flagellar hook-associated protein FlgL [Massilia]|jgi:flagellar hook-associated protein 3 FlgL|uniref:flagellar hook-associated protein FlgL n=1 Tax=Massilia TaxID=149698 RepID=UPI001C62BA3E|nr:MULTISPECIES: flagellar hook-associated protein FlgL [Massilia]QYG01463.1 flagellar hook-associated protein FlgL [Massilia sp. NP310]
MRIATAQYQSTMNQSLQNNQERLSYIMRQLDTQKRILLPSDDPVDSVRLSRLAREESTVGQYRSNISSLQLRLTKSEGYLSNMVTEMIPGRDQLVWALDGANTPDDLKAMIAPLQSLRDSLFYTANTIDEEGNYLFAGTATKTAPLALDADADAGARYRFAANTNAQLVVVGNGLTQPANENLAGLEKLLNQIDATIEVMSQPGATPNDPAVRAVLEANLNGFDDAQALISSKVADLGGRQNIIKTLDDNHANISLSNKMAITDIGALDVGVAATELNGYSTALQATYKAYAKIGNLSLFNAI